jgi:hypothetical protein
MIDFDWNTIANMTAALETVRQRLPGNKEGQNL